MKSFGTYISKHLASFAAFLLILVIVNVVLYGVTFYHTVSEDYGEASPRAMLELTSTAATTEGLPDYAEQKLRQYNIWAMYLTSTGECFWRLDVPQEVPQHYSIQEVALFSKGYLEDYPVFVWSTEDGLLVLGYPKNSYMKLTSNYYSMETIQKIPLYVIGMLGMDVLCLFLAYYFSKRRIIQNTEPIVDAIETLADGKPVSLHIDRELSEIANSVNKASLILSRQNEARANWISGVSHDIRTPLSMIMGYADRIAADKTASEGVKEQAVIVQKQSAKIKELVQDLNLVSQLEYDFRIRETQTYEIIEDVAKLRSEVGVLYLNHDNETVLRKVIREHDLIFTPFFTAKPHVFVSAASPLAQKKALTLDDLKLYPRLSYEQGEHNAFYFSEEILSTLDSKKDILVRDRATLFNLLIGLDGYTICSGVISEALNGPNIRAVPLLVDDSMQIGYLTHKQVQPGRFGKQYIAILKKYTEQV